MRGVPPDAGCPPPTSGGVLQMSVVVEKLAPAVLCAGEQRPHGDAGGAL